MSGPAQSVLALVKEATRKGADRPALLAPGRQPCTYGRLLQHLEATTVALARAGLVPGDRVAVVLPNGPEMASSFVAVAAAATCAPLNPNYREQEFEFYLTDLRAKALLLPEGFDNPVRAVAGRLNIPVLECHTDASLPAGCFELSGATDGYQPPGDGPPSDGTALVLHTSGTTARPKLVPLTHGNLRASAANIATSLRLTPSDRCLNVLPLFHIHGLMAAVLATWASGGSLVATPGFLATKFFDWLDEFTPTWYTAVPTVHQAILARASEHTAVISRRPLRFIRSSSAALPPAVLAELESVFGAPVIEAYGMTEAAHQMASNPLPPGTRKPGSVGPGAGPAIAILDDAGGLLATGPVGEVAIMGANVTAGYEANPEANSKAFTNGWFRTGDQGWIDEDGYLFLTGRLKELINRGGEKIAPREIDDVLSEHPAVAQALAFAVPDARLGEEVGAAVVLRSGTRASRQELLAFAAERLADFKLPRRIVFVDELPKGPTGKLQRVGAAERLGVTSVDIAPQTGESERKPGTETERLVARLFAEVLARGDVLATDGFFLLGGDSLLAVQLSFRIEEETGIEIPAYVLFDHSTVEALAAYLDAHDSNLTGRAGPARGASAGSQHRPSIGQELIWVREQLVRGTPVNHRPSAVSMRGRLDAAALGAALDELVARHEALRTTFVARGGHPVATVNAAQHIDLPEEVLDAVPETERETRLLDMARAIAVRGFDLRYGPLVHARLVRLEPTHHVLLLNIHHIAFDGWSMSVLVSELAALYQAKVDSVRHGLAELPFQFGAWAEWQRGLLERGEMDDAITLWRRALDHAPDPYSVFAVSSPRPPATGRGSELRLTLGAPLVRRLGDMARAEGGTLFTGLLATLATVFKASGAPDDLVLGTIVSGRTTRNASRLIGFFVNELPLRLDLSGNPTFHSLLGRARQVSVEAFARQHVPFGHLVRTLSTKGRFRENPFFNVVFQLRNIPVARASAGSVTFKQMSLAWGLAGFDLLVEATEGDAALELRFEYSDDAGDTASVAAVVDAFDRVARRATTDPDQPLSRISS